jgi:twinkle protein
MGRNATKRSGENRASRGVAAMAEDGCRSDNPNPDARAHGTPNRMLRLARVLARTAPMVLTRSSGCALSTFVSSHFQLERSELSQTLSHHGLDAKESGDHLIVRECPLCSKPTMGRADNMWKLYILKASGAFFCHRCGTKGSWFDLKQRLAGKGGSGKVTVDGLPAAAVPPAHQALASTAGVAKATRALLDDGLFPSVYEYLTRVRGLSEDVLRLYSVGATTWRFLEDDISRAHPSSTSSAAGPPSMFPATVVYPPKREERSPPAFTEHSCVVFPWVDPSSHVHRVKLRSVSDKRRQTLVPRGGGWSFFGAHTVPTGARSIVLTEGEFDAMAVRQATGVPTVSLPNGARSLPVELLPWMEQFQRIFLWMDEDGAGMEGGQMMAKKLGPGRCFLVRTSEGRPEVLPDASDAAPALAKDANDALRNGYDLSKCLARAAPLPHKQVLTFDDLRSSVVQEVTNRHALSGDPIRVLPGLQELLQGHRRGELTVLTGPTGAGKTTILSQLSLDLAAQGIPTLWGSFEVKNTRLLRTMMHQFVGRNLDNEPAKSVDAVADVFSKLPLFFLRYLGPADVDDVIEAMQYAAYAHDVAHVVIDNLQFMMSGFARVSCEMVKCSIDWSSLRRRGWTASTPRRKPSASFAHSPRRPTSTSPWWCTLARSEKGSRWHCTRCSARPRRRKRLTRC